MHRIQHNNNNREVVEKQRQVYIAKAGNLEEYIESSCNHETENEDQYDNEFRDDASVKRLSEAAESHSDNSSSETGKQMRVSLANLAREADSYGVSNRAAASFATAVLVDFGIVTNADRSKVIDKNKLRRERIKLRKQFQENANTCSNKITSLYFDGRNKDTLTRERKTDKLPFICFSSLMWVLKMEEHCVLVAEPGNKHLSHVSPKSNKSKDIADCILSEIDMDVSSDIRVVDCDCEVLK